MLFIKSHRNSRCHHLHNAESCALISNPQQRQTFVADANYNPENERKSRCRIKRGMTNGNHVIADLIRNS
jgi:hypothetical protein